MRILGIDLGSSSIKAVEMDSAFGRYDIHDYHERPVGADQSPEEAIIQLVKSLPKPPDRVVVSLGTKSTFRNLQLPTRDKKAIQAGVGFEIEDELPFSAEESIFDYTVLSQNKQGSSIHVAATLKHYLSSALETWKKTNVDPDVITTDPWAYRALCNRVFGANKPESPVLLVQIGHTRTTLYLHWQGVPKLIREVQWGGRDLTEAISQKYGLSPDQAEAAKLDRGSIAHADPNVQMTPEQIEFSACLENAMGVLLTELKQVELMSRNATQLEISGIYLAGGTSLLPGLGSWLEEYFSIPTKPILALSSATTSGVTYSDQTDARFILAVALTLTLVGSDRTTCLNFRKGEFSKQGTSRQINIKALKKPILAVSGVFFCLFLSLIIQSGVYKARLAATDVLLEKTVRSFFGQISSSALRTYMSNPSTLRTSINKELTKQRELSKLFGPNQHSPLDLLNTFSASIPKNIVVDLTQFQTGMSATDSFVTGDPTSTASFNFTVSNPQVAERLAVLMSTRFTHFQRGKMEEVASADESSGTGNIKKWKITFSGKPTEDSYVK